MVKPNIKNLAEVPSDLRSLLSSIERASEPGRSMFQEVAKLVDLKGKDEAFLAVQTFLPTITRENLEWMLRVARGQCEADALQVVRFMADHQAGAKNS